MAVNLVAEGGRGPRPPCLPAWLLYYATLCMSLHSIRVAACESMAAGPVGCQRHCSNQASSAAPSCAPTGAPVTEGCHSSHLCVPVFTGEWGGCSFSFNFHFYFIFFSTLIMTSSPTVMMSLQLLLLSKRWTPPSHSLTPSLSPLLPLHRPSQRRLSVLCNWVIFSFLCLTLASGNTARGGGRGLEKGNKKVARKRLHFTHMCACAMSRHIWRNIEEALHRLFS